MLRLRFPPVVQMRCNCPAGSSSTTFLYQPVDRCVRDTVLRGKLLNRSPLLEASKQPGGIHGRQSLRPIVVSLIYKLPASLDRLTTAAPANAWPSAH